MLIRRGPGSMAALSPIRLLLLNPSPATSSTVRAELAGDGQEYEILDITSPEEFTGQLRTHRPQLVLADEGGIAGVSLKEALEAAHNHRPQIPVIVLGEGRAGRSSLRVLRKGAFLNVTEMEKLPSIIGRLLSEEGSKGKQSKTRQEQLRDAAGLMRENQRLVTIGRLTGSIAHEINNPLESVTNLLFLIDHEPGLSPRVRDYLTMAQRELERVVQISKQTLNFYRDTASPVPVRLSELLNEVLVLYARRISDKRVKVIRRFGSEEPLVVLPGEIRQVFSNLIANAIEASAEHGKLYLRIRKSRFWGDPRIVGMRVTIADNGIGMSPEVSRRVGEAFFTTKGQGGTGLGLWVSHSIIERYGGNLFLKSSTGERHGTVFSTLLPTNLRPQVVGSSVDSEPHDEEKSLNWLANGA